MSGESKKFEQQMKRLEEIVDDLDKGDHSLEDSLRKFEEGLKLGKSCKKVLEKAEAKVKILVEAPDGTAREEDAPDEFGD